MKTQLSKPTWERRSPHQASSKDSGAAHAQTLILDNRIVTKPYGRVFL
jgi:hypothetical protein